MTIQDPKALTVEDLFQARALLFVPALRTDYLAKAVAAAPAVVILDLEDSIPPDAKDAARDALAPALEVLRGASMPVFIRVNGGSRPDLEACARLRPGGVLLPKVSEVAEIDAAQDILGDRRALLLAAAIESARGVLNAAALADHPAVAALMFGAGDFCAETGFEMTPAALQVPAALIALAARAAGKPALGLAGSMGDIRDLVGLRHTAEISRSIGYSGAPVIHPAQVAVAAAAFAPSAAEVARAQAVVAAFEAGAGGASRHENQLIERPVYLRALAILQTAATRADRTQAD